MAYRWIPFDADNTVFHFGRSTAEALLDALGGSFAGDPLSIYLDIDVRVGLARIVPGSPPGPAMFLIPRRLLGVRDGFDLARP